MSGMEMSEKITKEMIIAGIRACNETPPLSDAILVQNVYAAMRAAEPSPAGQGDALEAVVEAICYDEHGIQVANVSAVVRERIRSALAARQPTDFDDEELQFYREEALNLPNILIGAGVFSVDHDGDYKAAWANIMDAIERLAARQPVGQEPDDYVEFLDRQNDSLRRAIHAIMAKLAFLLDEDQFADMDAIALAAGVSPPAQAVDLGQFRDLIGFAALAAINLPETDPRRDFIRQANEFVKLIDGKEVQA